jgi:hypothetical protein
MKLGSIPEGKPVEPVGVVSNTTLVHHAGRWDGSIGPKKESRSVRLCSRNTSAFGVERTSSQSMTTSVFDPGTDLRGGINPIIRLATLRQTVAFG